MLSRHVGSALLVAVGVGAGAMLAKSPTYLAAAGVTAQTDQSLDVAAGSDWIAAGPGKVEPISGETSIAATSAGRIDKIVVRVRDKVAEGELLAIVDDSEQLARVQAAEAEVSFREAERDNAISSSLPNQRQSAEDSVANSQSEVWRSQLALDRLSATGVSVDALNIAKASLAHSRELLAESRNALSASEKSNDAPRPTRTESALAVARAERAIAYAVLEKTRIRAPRAGTVLNILKQPGDTASAASDDTVIAMGDIDRLRVRAEIDEVDIANVTLGQRVVVRSDAFPEKDFAGAVSFIAALARPRGLAAHQAVSTVKDNAIQVIVDLAAASPLVPGMRVDVFFEPTQSSNSKGDGLGTN